MVKVVVNNCYGGFGLSQSALKLGKKITGNPRWGNDMNELNRDDPTLIQVVEQLGTKVNTDYSKLTIIEIPDDVEWKIEEYDGAEWVAEKHRVWRAE